MRSEGGANRAEARGPEALKPNWKPLSYPRCRDNVAKGEVGGGRWALSGGQFHQSWQGANLNLHGLLTRELGSPAKLEKTETRQGQEPDVQGLLGQSAPDLEHKVLII